MQTSPAFTKQCTYVLESRAISGLCTQWFYTFALAAALLFIINTSMMYNMEFKLVQCAYIVGEPSRMEGTYKT